MRRLFVEIIRAYWRLVPPERRRTCLFATSCSRHVHDVVVAEGATSGLRALWGRVRACRPGYFPLQTRGADGTLLFRLADGRIVAADEMSEAIRTRWGQAPES